MSVALAWILIGLASGFVATSLTEGGGQGLMLDLMLGVIGALVTGGIVGLVGQSSEAGLAVESIVASILGATLFLFGYHAMRGPRMTA
jgi:uncharacterized membrane protein YeaQ/YmgE (transglycosylase-associated protein family)